MNNQSSKTVFCLFSESEDFIYLSDHCRPPADDKSVNHCGKSLRFEEPAVEIFELENFIPKKENQEKRKFYKI